MDAPGVDFLELECIIRMPNLHQKLMTSFSSQIDSIHVNNCAYVSVKRRVQRACRLIYEARFRLKNRFPEKNNNPVTTGLQETIVTATVTTAASSQLRKLRNILITRVTRLNSQPRYPQIAVQ